VLRQLGATEAREFEKHLEQCGACRERVAESRRIAEIVRDAYEPGEEVDPEDGEQ
jgi:anti-sigma factor RsiW